MSRFISFACTTMTLNIVAMPVSVLGNVRTKNLLFKITIETITVFPVFSGTMKTMQLTFHDILCFLPAWNATPFLWRIFINP